MQVSAFSCASWKLECACAILSRNRCAFRFCDKGLCSLNLNARWISLPFSSATGHCSLSFSLWIHDACSYILPPFSPIFFCWSTTPHPVHWNEMCPPNDRHRFSSQTFLRQLRWEKNRYCEGRPAGKQVGRQWPRPPLSPSAYSATILAQTKFQGCVRQFSDLDPR